MKHSIVFTEIMVISMIASDIFAQSNCRVLMPSISITYDGSCKQGLADGKGEATGTDRYIGDFRKGLPEGEGVYIWHTGERYVGEWKKGLRDGEGVLTFKYLDRDSVLAGIWKEDKYVGEREVAPYVIEYRDGIGRISVFRTGDRPYVRYKFSRNGAESNSISNLLLQGSSGSESMTASFTGFEQVTFPFKGKVVFKAPNNFYTAILNCELRLTINNPGAWVVTIFY
jgi:hypothetical protein